MEGTSERSAAEAAEGGVRLSVAGFAGVVMMAFGLGIVVGGVVLPQSRARCYRRYARLCARWFADDPVGENGCLDRAWDVCSW